MPVTSEGRVALYLQDKHPIREGMEYVKLAEAKGFEAVWQAESRLVREAKQRGVKVTAETCPHYFTRTEEAVRGYNTMAKMNPPLRKLFE